MANTDGSLLKINTLQSRQSRLSSNLCDDEEPEASVAKAIPLGKGFPLPARYRSGTKSTQLTDRFHTGSGISVGVVLMELFTRKHLV